MTKAEQLNNLINTSDYPELLRELINDIYVDKIKGYKLKSFDELRLI